MDEDSDIEEIKTDKHGSNNAKVCPVCSNEIIDDFKQHLNQCVGENDLAFNANKQENNNNINTINSESNNDNNTIHSENDNDINTINSESDNDINTTQSQIDLLNDQKVYESDDSLVIKGIEITPNPDNINSKKNNKKIKIAPNTCNIDNNPSINNKFGFNQLKKISVINSIRTDQVNFYTNI